VADYSQLIQLQPDNAEAYYNRGICYDTVGQLDLAIEDYNKVLMLDPGHVSAAYKRATCQNRRGNFMAAICDYQLALEKDQEKTREVSPKKRTRPPKNFDTFLQDREKNVRASLTRNSFLSESTASAAFPNDANRSDLQDSYTSSSFYPTLGMKCHFKISNSL
jgi:tetratricopeptide (TPR) repeat protein